MDRKWFLGCFERKHIIQSYGPSLIRQSSPEVPNHTRTAVGLGVICKLFLTEPLAWHLPKFSIPIQVSPPWPVNSCLVALIQADSQQKINLSAPKKRKSCWEILQFLCLVQSRARSFFNKVSLIPSSPERTSLFLAVLIAMGSLATIFFNTARNAERRQNCQKRSLIEVFDIQHEAVTLTEINRLAGKSQDLSQPQIISSSEGTSAPEGQQVPSNLFHGEKKTHESTVTWRSAAIFLPVTMQSQL